VVHWKSLQRKHYVIGGTVILALALAVGHYVVRSAAAFGTGTFTPPRRPRPGGPLRRFQERATFHLPSCTSARRISPDNIETFATREEAIARPCSVQRSVSRSVAQNRGCCWISPVAPVTVVVFASGIEGRMSMLHTVGKC